MASLKLMDNNYIFSGREFKDNLHSSSNSIQIGDYMYTKENIYKMKILVNRIAEKLDLKLNKTASFDDYIYSEIQNHSVEKVYMYFDLYKFLWNDIGRDITDFEDVFYNNITLRLKDHSRSASDIIIENDSIVKNVTNHYNKQNDIIKDNQSFQIDKEELSNKVIDENDNFKWFNPFSFKGTIYLFITGLIIYFLYKYVTFTYIGFLIIGALILFAFIYFEDNYKKK